MGPPANGPFGKYKSMLIDSDEAKKLIPEFDDGFGAGYVHEESKQVVTTVRIFLFQKHIQKNKIFLPLLFLLVIVDE